MSAADMLEEKMWIIIRCEKSVTIIILIRLDYLVHNFGNYTITLTTDIGNCKRSFHFIGGVVRLPLPSRWRRCELAYIGFRVAELRLAFFSAAPISIGNHMVGSLESRGADGYDC